MVLISTEQSSEVIFDTYCLLPELEKDRWLRPCLLVTSNQPEDEERSYLEVQRIIAEYCAVEGAKRRIAMRIDEAWLLDLDKTLVERDVNPHIIGWLGEGTHGLRRSTRSCVVANLSPDESRRMVTHSWSAGLWSCFEVYLGLPELRPGMETNEVYKALTEARTVVRSVADADVAHFITIEPLQELIKAVTLSCDAADVEYSVVAGGWKHA